MDHDKNKASELRQVIAAIVASDPDKYSEAFLEMTTEEYCTWILNPEKWGGAIELAILADYCGREIAAYDIQTTRCDIYGQDKSYNERAMLIYDGLHYDALAMSPFEGAPEEFDQTIFNVLKDQTLGPVDQLALNLVKDQQRLPITETDEYIPWWAARYDDIIPDSLEIPDMQGTKRKWDMPSTTQSKKPKHILELSSKPVKAQQGKKLVSPILPNKRTRASTKLLGEVSKSKLNQTTVSVTLDYDNDAMPSATNVSVADSETESDDHTHFSSFLSLPNHIETTPWSYASGSGKTLLDLTRRRAMVSSVEEDMDFDFSFLGSEPSQTVSSSFTPSGLELATAKASLRHFLNMNLSTLGTMEKVTVLSAASILKSSPEFSQPSVFGILDTLDSMFTSFQDSSSTCSETLIQVGNFKAQKEKLDGMLSERNTLLSTLQQKNKDFDAKEELVKKLETKLAQKLS